jgi:hypothetical protein
VWTVRAQVGCRGPTSSGLCRVCWAPMHCRSLSALHPPIHAAGGTHGGCPRDQLLKPQLCLTDTQDLLDRFKSELPSLLPIDPSLRNCPLAPCPLPDHVWGAADPRVPSLPLLHHPLPLFPRSLPPSLPENLTVRARCGAGGHERCISPFQSFELG